ncbi:MAG: serine/threonine-protein kinase [Oscillospiraceae bacterium]
MLKKNTRLATAFEEYIIHCQIGQGGNGTVFEATDSSRNAVAIKAIDRDATTKDKLKRFKNEIGFCQNNTHPNIIEVLDYGTYLTDNQNIIFYVMPFFNNTLRAKMKEGIKKNNIFPIFMQLLDGIGFAHSKGVWHRDIKPENILIDAQTNRVAIADFGIAHFSQDMIVTSIETKATDKLANFVYAAPEQRERNGVVDGHCDIFSLGLILNEMFTGTVIAGTNYKTVSDVDRNYGFVDTIIEMMTAQSRLNRPYPAQNVAYQLKALIKEKQIHTELEQLVNTTIQNEEAFDYPCPQIIDIEYKDGILQLYLNKVTPPLWNQILTSGGYSHSSIVGYDAERFVCSNYGNNTVFKIPVRTESSDIIESIVRNFKAWLPVTTSMYVSQVINSRRQERIKKEQEMLRLTKQKEAEKNIASKLKAFL